MVFTVEWLPTVVMRLFSFQEVKIKAMKERELTVKSFKHGEWTVKEDGKRNIFIDNPKDAGKVDVVCMKLTTLKMLLQSYFQC